MTTYEAVWVADTLHTDGGTLVLTEHRLFDLGPTGATVLAIEGPFTMDQAQEALVDRFGPPPSGDAAMLTAAVVDDLVVQGLVVKRNVSLP